MAVEQDELDEKSNVRWQLSLRDKKFAGKGKTIFSTGGK